MEREEGSKRGMKGSHFLPPLLLNLSMNHLLLLKFFRVISMSRTSSTMIKYSLGAATREFFIREINNQGITIIEDLIFGDFVLPVADTI